MAGCRAVLCQTHTASQSWRQQLAGCVTAAWRLRALQIGRWADRQHTDVQAGRDRQADRQTMKQMTTSQAPAAMRDLEGPAAAASHCRVNVHRKRIGCTSQCLQVSVVSHGTHQQLLRSLRCCSACARPLLAARLLHLGSVGPQVRDWHQPAPQKTAMQPCTGQGQVLPSAAAQPAGALRRCHTG
jgi:hypothetical protein